MTFFATYMTPNEVFDDRGFTIFPPYLHNSVFLILLKWIKLTSFPLISCSLTINSNWQDSASSVHDIYHELIDAGIRIWMFRFTYSSINLSSCSFLINRFHTLTLKSFHKYTTHCRCF